MGFPSKGSGAPVIAPSPWPSGHLISCKLKPLTFVFPIGKAMGLGFRNDVLSRQDMPITAQRQHRKALLDSTADESEGGTRLMPGCWRLRPSGG